MLLRCMAGLFKIEGAVVVAACCHLCCWGCRGTSSLSLACHAEMELPTAANQIGLGVLPSPLALWPLWELTSRVLLGQSVSHSWDSGRMYYCRDCLPLQPTAGKLTALCLALRLWHSCALLWFVAVVILVLPVKPVSHSTLVLPVKPVSQLILVGYLLAFAIGLAMIKCCSNRTYGPPRGETDYWFTPLSICSDSPQNYTLDTFLIQLSD
jgi:hypothetical protein